MGTKDASDFLRGKWGIELPELAFQKKAELETQKAFISRRVERFRPAYGREEICYERRCVFWGTTNRADYMKDETGNRRFLPIKVESVDLVGLKANRDKLWAEAVYYYKRGEKWHLDSSGRVTELYRSSEYFIVALQEFDYPPVSGMLSAALFISNFQVGGIGM
jgi:predicted P-loop ATPase